MLNKYLVVDFCIDWLVRTSECRRNVESFAFIAVRASCISWIKWHRGPYGQ
jgi:hypothetical protein